MNILALDASSTTIGWVCWDGAAATAHGTIALKGDLIQRLRLADLALADLLRQHAPDCVALEGPTTRFPSHVIAQQRVCGVLLLRCALVGVLSLEISGSQAKKALTGAGNCTKQTVQRHAARYLNDADEHACDALAVAVAAAPLIQMEAAQ